MSLVLAAQTKTHAWLSGDHNMWALLPGMKWDEGSRGPVVSENESKLLLAQWDSGMVVGIGLVGNLRGAHHWPEGSADGWKRWLLEVMRSAGRFTFRQFVSHLRARAAEEMSDFTRFGPTYLQLAAFDRGRPWLAQMWCISQGVYRMRPNTFDARWQVNGAFPSPRTYEPLTGITNGNAVATLSAVNRTAAAANGLASLTCDVVCLSRRDGRPTITGWTVDAEGGVTPKQLPVWSVADDGTITKPADRPQESCV